MVPNDQPMHLTLQIGTGEEGGDGEGSEITRQLLHDLEVVDVESAELVTDEAPQDTRSVEAVTISSLALVVLPVFLDKLIDFLIAWAKRDEKRAITIKTEVNGVPVEVTFDPTKNSPEELKKMVETWHSGGQAHPRQTTE